MVFSEVSKSGGFQSVKTGKIAKTDREREPFFAKVTKMTILTFFAVFGRFWSFSGIPLVFYGFSVFSTVLNMSGFLMDFEQNC